MKISNGDLLMKNVTHDISLPHGDWRVSFVNIEYCDEAFDPHVRLRLLRASLLALISF